MINNCCDRDRILGKWAHVDRYAYCNFMRGQEVDVWDCDKKRIVWKDVGSCAFVHIPGYPSSLNRSHVYGRQWEPQFLLFPAWYFRAAEIEAALDL